MDYNRFDKAQWGQQFATSTIYQQLSKDYPTLVSEICDLSVEHLAPTVRYGTGPYVLPRTEFAKFGIFSYSIFYYLELLLKSNPNIILDVGCGDNVFKKYIPQIVGMDPVREAADIRGYFDDEFVANHPGEYDSAMTISAIHHVSLLDFKDLINKFGKIIKPGGRGFVAFNLARLISSTEPHEFAQIFDLSRPVTIFDYYCYIKKELEKTNYQIVAADILYTFEQHYFNCAGPDWPSIEKYAARDFSNVHELIVREIMQLEEAYVQNWGLNDTMDGNIKIVFEV